MSMIYTNMTEDHGCVDHIGFARSKNSLFYDLPGFITSFKPDILVLAHGPHAHDDGDMETVLKNIYTQFSSVPLELTRNITLLWKSISPGHLDCEAATAPVEPNTDVVKRYYSANSTVDVYGWNGFLRWDRMVKVRS